MNAPSHPAAAHAITIAATAAYMLELLPGEFEGTWKAAVAWAKSQGGELPTRIEQIHLFNQARDQFARDLYWSGEQLADGGRWAWYQGFNYGSQYYGTKGNKLRARAVRRVPIQPLTPEAA